MPYKTKHTLKITLLLIALCIFSCINVHAQVGHSELWGTYSTRKYLSEKRFWIRNDYSIRTSFTTEPATALLLRPRAILNVGNYLELVPAVDFRYSIYPELPNIMEIRTWEGISLNWPQIKRIMFDHFYRFEQRFYITEGSANDDIGLRSRYRLRMRLPINKRAITEKTFYTDLQFEAFIPHDDNIDELFANTIRLGVVAGYNHNPSWRYILTFYVDRGRNNFNDDVTNDRAIISLLVRNTF